MRKALIVVGLLAAAALVVLTVARGEPAPRSPGRAEAPTVSVFPVPGAAFASRATQISLRGAAADALRKITAAGSVSGPHTGELRPHSDGRGASFVPDEPFRAGERVTVRTDLTVRGARAGRFSFAVARTPARERPRAAEASDVGNGELQSYVTRPDFEPPAVTVTAKKAGRAPGLVFLAPKAGRGQDGPMIVDDDGELVWFKPMASGDLAADFRVQRYKGKPALTWWHGRLFVGDGVGEGVVYDQSYEQIATIRAGNGFTLDLHEVLITSQDTALVMSYERVRRDLRPWGGPRNGLAVDNVLQEIDIETGLVLFEWHSLDDVDLAESHAPVPDARGGEWDYFHINSAAVDRDGDFVISARNSWGVYKIDREAGRVVWRLGGKRSTFEMGRGTSTSWQHSARPQPDGTIMIFDNGAAPATRKHSRAIRVRLDTRARTATLVSALVHPRGLLSATQGNVEPLPDGNTFVGYGSQPWFSEYSADGRLVFDGRIARGNDNYRAFRAPWTGTPMEPPRIVATVRDGRVTTRASWNGATSVARWQLLAGTDAESLVAIADAPRRGFETAVTASTSEPLVAMRALGTDGKTLATTKPVRPVPE